MSTPAAEWHWTPPVGAGSRRSVAVGASALAVLGLAGGFLAQLVVNAPLGTPGGVPVGGTSVGIAPGFVAALAVGTTATATIAIALTEPDPLAGVGLLFVGVFGLLALLARAAATPTALALVGGVACVAMARRDALDQRRLVGTLVRLGGLALALLSGVGGVTGLRPLASTLALVGVAATPVFAGADLEAVLGGLLAFALVVGVGLSMPFVTGAVTLVTGGVVGASLPVVALGVAGAVTTASAAVRTGRWLLLTGVLLVALAGVPAALTRAVPFALGVALLTSAEVTR